ncbi:hypothetical protein MWU54_11190 [Marivita sp. S6314]|uniref:hypothetical protein n=1 Tax=Marivita sp. S6314 TaxID=2926406 RepID=UPI001FF2954A|nr:hypothetical protein [Marivita sp. S6314]MCK0150592.1 hypothetical protein [Marivita sp. S6314]
MGLAAILGAWDFFAQAKAAEGQYTLQKYATSVSERYGDDAASIADSAGTLAKAGYRAGVAWTAETGWLEALGIEAIAPQPDEAVVVMQDADSEVETIVVASAGAFVAPETSLFPRARAEN